MPVTPRFRITQDDDFLYIAVRVPFVRVSDMEFLLDGKNFSFHCKPYLLQLVLPEEVVEDDRCKGVYDAEADNGTITVHAPKATPGQHFEGLDMISRLVAGPATASDMIGEDVDAGMKQRWSRHLAAAEAATPSPEDELRRRVHEEAAAAEAAAERRRRAAAAASGAAPRPLIEVVAEEEFEAPAEPAAGAAPSAEPNTDAVTSELGRMALEGHSCSDDAPPATASDAVPAASSPPDDPSAGASAPEDPLPAMASPASLAASAAAAAAGGAWAGGAPTLAAASGPGCGFAGRYHGVFRDHAEELPLLLEGGADPDGTPAAFRAAALAAAEAASFDEGRYVSDTVLGEDDPVYVSMMSAEPHWEKARVARKAYRKAVKVAARTAEAAAALEQAGAPQPEQDEAKAAAAAAAGAVPAPDCWWDGWTDKEQQVLAELRRKAPLLEKGSTEWKVAQAHLVSHLVASAYDGRFDQEEPGSESAWTLVTLDPCLSWQTLPETALEALSAAATRALTRPYLRRWDVAASCLSDACVMLSLGGRAVVRTLIRSLQSLQHSELYSLMARVHIEDMLLWVQSLSEADMAAAYAECSAAVRSMSRGSIALPLAAAEERAARVMAGEEPLHGEEEEDDDDGGESSSSSEEEEEEEDSDDTDDEADDAKTAAAAPAATGEGEEASAAPAGGSQPPAAEGAPAVPSPAAPATATAIAPPSGGAGAGRPLIEVVAEEDA
ncbi:hypothetical protein FNF29_00036 [Cafeteria roenbergensis]|uniref:CS domain-containing protein n=1 Tax=Cafeteria roenbergensis TaxID=33653 RepID=A0A5A8CZ75_CAFRO|nr:hypothetical protein FNF29_00036 [Cafeteria roenbergensis]|eukprot:KAA0157460.1 hypothetical protein FNF29_00036 [Cafeteria roenbergensis]